MMMQEKINYLELEPVVRNTIKEIQKTKTLNYNDKEFLFLVWQRYNKKRLFYADKLSFYEWIKLLIDIL